jgi:ketosteroid isomerase-like protein
MSEMTLDRLAEFGDAWRRHDVDALMSFMADDCEYRASVGPDPGTIYRGRAEVRRGFAEILAHDDADEGHNGITIISGRYGAGQWVLVQTDDEGRETRIEGCDFFEFDGDLITLKDAYRKTFSSGRVTDA